MTNVLQQDIDIPCKVTLLTGMEGKYVCYLTDPTADNDEGWANYSPLGTYFTMEERKHIKKTLQKQGWYTMMMEMDAGYPYIIVVVPCPKDQWYKPEEK